MNEQGVAEPKIRTQIKVENRLISELKPFAKNARQHSPQQIAQIAASMKEFGWTMPLLIKADGEIIAGHGRALAAQSLELEHVPVIVAAHLTAEQCRAYVLADNQLALNATWDNLTLAEEITGLKLEGFDMNLLGFSDADFAQIFPNATAGGSAKGEWGAMPEFDNEKISHRDLIMHFKDQQSVDAFAALLNQEIGENTKSLWFPELPREVNADKAYVSE